MGDGDRKYQQVPIKLIYNLNIPLLSDYFTIQCEDIIKKNKSSIKNNFYQTLPYASIHYDSKIRDRLATVEKTDDDFNVLVLGLDSVSRLQFERMLPQTYDYVNKELGGILLKGLFN
jgi:hypothetical protein